MAISHKTALLGVDDLKIFPITNDSEESYTVGDGIDVPGVRQISLTYEIEEKNQII